MNANQRSEHQHTIPVVSGKSLVVGSPVHVPVLLREVMEVLDPKPGEFFIDGTLDGGGYARAILERLGSSGAFLGIDWDTRAIHNATQWLAPYEERGISLHLASGNFAHVSDMADHKSLGRADGLVLDLGLSSDQLESSGRGFSFQKDEPLIMRYGDDVAHAHDALRALSENELANIIRTLSQERFAGQIARAIKQALRKKPITTSKELTDVIVSAVPKHYERGRLHPATRTFLALRMYVNREVENLEAVLAALPHLMKPGGRVAIVSFHSTEDGLVKQQFRNYARSGVAGLVTKKPIIASDEERAQNPRARSAKLRAIRISPS